MADAEQNFRVRVQPLAPVSADQHTDWPALVLVSTDGYVNSFSDEAGFLKVGSDLLEMLRGDGFDAVNAQLSGWLEEATRIGSGDDTTVAIICRMNALAKPTADAAAPASLASPATVAADHAAADSASSPASLAAPLLPPNSGPTPAAAPAVPAVPHEQTA